MADSKSKHQVEISAIDRATPVVKGIEGAFKNLGAFVGGSVLVGAFATATKAAIDFEQGLAKTATLLPAASGNMDKFSEGLKKIHATGISRTLGELTEGLYETVSAGIPAEKSLKFLEIAAKTAKGGFTDVRTAVDGLTTVLNAYQLSAEQATHVADVMFVTQNRGKVTIGEMAGSLGQILPIASSVGVSFEEISAAISTLTIKGIPATLAITGLRATIAAFIERGDSAKLKTMGLSGAIQDLERQTGGSATKMQEYLGRVEALNTVSALTGASTKQFASDLAAIKGAAGVADEAVKAFTDNAAGRLDKLKGVAQVFAVEVGDAIAKGLLSKEVVDRTTTATSTVGDLFVWMANRISGAVGENIKNINSQMTALDKLWQSWKTSFGNDPLFNSMSQRGAGGTFWGGSGVNAPTQYGAPNPVPSFNTGYSPGDVANLGGMWAGHGQSLGEWANAAAAGLKGVADSAYKTSRAISVSDAKVLGRRFFGVAGVRDSRDPYGESEGLLGGMFPQARGVRNIRSPYGDTQADRMLNQDFRDTPMGASIGQLEERILMIAPAFQQMMSAVTNTIVQGLMTGKGQIVDVLNALKGAILSILSQIAAKMAVVGLLSLIPGVGSFKSVLDLLGGGLFGAGGGNRRIVPIGASPNAGTFGGGRPVIVNIGTVYGADADILTAQIEQKLAYRMRSGTSKMLYSAVR